jgi:hypothetical protein
MDYIVLISIWCLTIIGLLYFVRRNEIREAFVIYFFKQCMTWVLGLLVVEYGLIEYPVREFQKANATSFSFEYFIYPAICVVFNLRYPINKSLPHRIGWFLFFPTWITIVEVLLEQNTKLIHYIHWSWYWTWITLYITFYFSMKFYRWFFKIK